MIVVRHGTTVCHVKHRTALPHNGDAAMVIEECLAHDACRHELGLHADAVASGSTR